MKCILLYIFNTFLSKKKKRKFEITTYFFKTKKLTVQQLQTVLYFLTRGGVVSFYFRVNQSKQALSSVSQYAAGWLNTGSSPKQEQPSRSRHNSVSSSHDNLAHLGDPGYLTVLDMDLVAHSEHVRFDFV